MGNTARRRTAERIDKHDLKRCSTLVLVGSKNAAESENVGLEVKEFFKNLKK